jgi:uncharacterized cupin superfamily protein
VAHAFGSIDELGDGPGFRSVRRALGVSAFGVNAVVFPPGMDGFEHYHDEQDELYFVHQGDMEIELGDGSVHPLPQGTFAHVEAHTPRRLRNVGQVDAIYLCAGGKGGYVGRDGKLPEGEQRVSGPHGAAGS